MGGRFKGTHADTAVTYHQSVGVCVSYDNPCFHVLTNVFVLTCTSECTSCMYGPLFISSMGAVSLS